MTGETPHSVRESTTSRMKNWDGNESRDVKIEDPVVNGKVSSALS